MDASSSTTGLGGAEAPEPHSGLGPSDAIPCAVKTADGFWEVHAGGRKLSPLTFVNQTMAEGWIREWVEWNA